MEVVNVSSNHSTTLTGGEPPTLRQPYLLFLGDATDPRHAKTALGLSQWVPDLCVGEWALPSATVTTGLPRLGPTQAHARGARSLVIGLAKSGGGLAPAWVPCLFEALAAGLDIVSGLHTMLRTVPGLGDAAARHGRALIDVRTPPTGIPVATGAPRSGKRLLTVGTDCGLGKKFTALALARALGERGVGVDFRATGQTGILIAGAGVPMDAVVADFAAGAAERLSPSADPDHWDVIEGQGALTHPAFAGVSLALLHGSQPDVIVVCHGAGRTATLGHPDHPVASIETTIALNLRLGARTNPAIRCAGVSLKTATLSDAEARAPAGDRGPASGPTRRGPGARGSGVRRLGGRLPPLGAALP